MEERVLTAIRHITADKIMRRIEPHNALLSELYQEFPGVNIREACVLLYRKGLIEGGQTINDSWFKALPTPEEIEQMNRKIL